MFGFQRRFVRRCECDTIMPHDGRLPQTSQTAAMGRASRRSNAPVTECGFERPVPAGDTAARARRGDRSAGRRHAPSRSIGRRDRASSALASCAGSLSNGVRASASASARPCTCVGVDTVLDLSPPTRGAGSTAPTRRGSRPRARAGGAGARHGAVGRRSARPATGASMVTANVGDGTGRLQRRVLQPAVAGAAAARPGCRSRCSARPTSTGAACR